MLLGQMIITWTVLGKLGHADILVFVNKKYPPESPGLCRLQLPLFGHSDHITHPATVWTSTDFPQSDVSGEILWDFPHKSASYNILLSIFLSPSLDWTT